MNFEVFTKMMADNGTKKSSERQAGVRAEPLFSENEAQICSRFFSAVTVKLLLVTAVIFGMTSHTAFAAEKKAGLSVHLNPYIVGHIGDMPITATLLTVWLVMVLLIITALLVRKNLSLVPSKFQNVIELMVGGAYDYIKDVLGSKKYADTYFPIITTIFIFILAINWIGLVPGIGAFGSYHDGKLVPWFYPGATDLNITIGFTLVAFFTIEVAGVLAIGFFKYASKFINFKSPMAFLLGLMELISELARLIAFSFRLFGNIFAGKTLLLVGMFFVPYFLPVPIYAYELFVGIIQALVFAILTLFFIKLAVEEPHH